MRKLFLAATLFVAGMCSAQVVIWNGEDKELGSDGGFWNRAEPTVVDVDGNKCLKITLKENAGGWADEHRMAALPMSEVNLNGLRRISMRIKMAQEHNVMIKLTKEGDGGYTDDDTRRWFWYGTPGEWQTLTYEYAVGPNSDKVADTGNTLIEIYPYEFDNKWGQEIFIDDIQLEGPVLKDGAAIRTLADGSLTSQQVEVTGSLRKGSYQNTWDGDWHAENYDDYALLLRKLSDDVCFLNLTQAAVSDGDGPQLRQKNANLLILSPTDFYDTDNVIRWNGEKNVTPKMVLSDAHPFYTPIDFEATTVELTRNLKAGINTLCLPFYVGEAEISAACKIATYTASTATTVSFSYADHADANVPFLATAVDAAAEKLTFTDKGVVNTPDFSGDFIGIYRPQSAEGKYGINDAGLIQRGAASATVGSFHAVLTAVPASARAITLNGQDLTAIKTIGQTGAATGRCYTLSGQQVAKPAAGVYIVDGKKVIMK